MRSDNYYSREDPGSAGWLVLSLFFPFVGFILWLAWSRVKPNSSRMAGMGLLLGFLFYIIVLGLLIGFIFISDGTSSEAKVSAEQTIVSQVQKEATEQPVTGQVVEESTESASVGNATVVTGESEQRIGKDSYSIEKKGPTSEEQAIAEGYTTASAGQPQTTPAPTGDQWGSGEEAYPYAIDLSKLYHKFWFVNQQASTHGSTTHFLLTKQVQEGLLGYAGTEPNQGHQKVNRRQSAISIQTIPTKEIKVSSPEEKTVKVNTEITYYQESPKEVQTDILQTGTVISRDYLYVTKDGELAIARGTGSDERYGFQQWLGYMYDDSTY